MSQQYVIKCYELYFEGIQDTPSLAPLWSSRRRYLFNSYAEAEEMMRNFPDNKTMQRARIVPA